MTHEEAASCRKALTRNPADVGALGLLILRLEQWGREYEAASAWTAFGATLELRGEYVGSAIAYREALLRKPDCLKALIGLGRVEVIVGRPSQAVGRFEAALALKAELQSVYEELGEAAHLAGDFERGRDAFAQSRLLTYRHQAIEQPLWDGSDLHGRTILLRADQALGDTIQYLRYVPLVAARGGRVVVQCHPTLLPLVERSPVQSATAPGVPLPHFDVYLPLLMLPYIFETTRSTIPADMPYLDVDEDLVRSWRQRLGPSAHKTVGIVWSGDPSHRKGKFRLVPFAAFEALAEIPGIRFVSLQLGPARQQLSQVVTTMNVLEVLDDTCTAADTAALILNLDLVITVDTLVAHLAGALAKPVWTLLPRTPAWFYGMTGDSVAWYPTMRLFRQTSAGDWADVFRRVRHALSSGV